MVHGFDNSTTAVPVADLEGAFVPVVYAENEDQAELYRERLVSRGIPVQIGMSAGAPTWAGLPLFVPESESELASELLASIDAQRADWDEDEDDEFEDDDDDDDDDDEFEDDELDDEDEFDDDDEEEAEEEDF
jgi:hypothetical protein